MTNKHTQLLGCLLTLACMAGITPVASALSLSPPKLGKQAASKSTAKAAEKALKADIRKNAEIQETEETKSTDTETTALTSPTAQAAEEFARLMEAQHHIVNNELRDDEEVVIKDVAMLWEAALERSGTIRYAIEKLSRRDATGKPVQGDNFTKKFIQSVTRLGGVAGSMWTGTPAGLIGSNMVEEILHGDPGQMATNRVTDADMLILAKEVEKLQSDVITAYYDYRHAKQRWQMTKDASHRLNFYRDQLLSGKANGGKGIDGISPELKITMLDSLFQSWKQEEDAAKQDYVSCRNSLGLLVGTDALIALEQAEKESAVLP